MKPNPTPSQAVSVPLAPAQLFALRTLANALKVPDEGRVAARVFSLGLFVLGLDPSGDSGLASITNALFGKGSDDAAEVFNAIVSTGDGAHDTTVNAARARRVPAKAAEAVSA